jgi:hypothetical protein
MGARKEVFISATSADLCSYRQVAKEAVLTLGAHPIEETKFPTDYRELQALLEHRLKPCDAIIHLAGFYYGGEPNAAPDTPRRAAFIAGFHRPFFSEKGRKTFSGSYSSGKEPMYKRALKMNRLIPTTKALESESQKGRTSAKIRGQSLKAMLVVMIIEPRS